MPVQDLEQQLQQRDDKVAKGLDSMTARELLGMWMT